MTVQSVLNWSVCVFTLMDDLPLVVAGKSVWETSVHMGNFG